MNTSETSTKTDASELLQVQGLKMHFPLRRRFASRGEPEVIRAVDGIDFSVRRGETLGLVGESGCGKTTAGRTIIQLHEPTSGSVRLDGIELTQLAGTELRDMRSHMQMIFQDPYSSLDKRMPIGRIVAEPLEVHKVGSAREKVDRVRELLHLVGLDPDSENRYPHEFSGGQRQRVAVARALALEPDLIVADEPLSALDVSVQAQIVNLLEDLQREFNLTYVFIAHDLAVVRHISDRVAVMYLGKIVELADCDELYERPLHPYTMSLLSAVPIPDPEIGSRRRRILLKGTVPDPASPPTGCRFHTRCPLRENLGNPEICSTMEPLLAEQQRGHWVSCHFSEGAKPDAPGPVPESEQNMRGMST